MLLVQVAQRLPLFGRVECETRDPDVGHGAYDAVLRAPFALLTLICRDLWRKK
jgi:hypothetical protein